MPSVSCDQPSIELQRLDRCLLTKVKAALVSDTQLELAIEVTFLPKPVKTGWIVRVECQVGSTGARFELSGQNVMARSGTPERGFPTTYSIERTVSREDKTAPSFNLKTGGSEAKLDLGSSSASSSEKRIVTFGGRECELAVVPIPGAGVVWHLRPHRGTKAVVDYLEGSTTLDATATWPQSTHPAMQVKAEPTDMRFFGPNGEILSALASISLFAKMVARLIPLPTIRPTIHKVFVSDYPG